MKNAVHGFPLLLLIVSAAFAQNALEQGQSTAEDLLGAAQSSVTTGDLGNTVPGFAGDPTQLPETIYYDSQAVEQLEVDGALSVESNPVNVFIWEQSRRPKLSFGDSHPIIENATAIGEDTAATADLGSITTCSTNTETRYDPIIDTCLSALEPEDHSCDRTRAVEVTWKETTNCPVGTGFAQELVVMNTLNQDDYASARAYCNPGAVPGTVEIQAYGWDGTYSLECGGWDRFSIPLEASGAPHFIGEFDASYHRNGCDEQIITTAQGACTDGACSYDIRFMEMGVWRVGGQDIGWFCFQGATLTWPVGWTGITHEEFVRLSGYRSSERALCVRSSGNVTVTFDQPETTRVASVEDSFQDDCASFAARAAP